MPKTNFSVEQEQVLDLTYDLATNNYASHIDGEKVDRKDLEKYLRDRINKDLLKGKTLYQAYRRNDIVLFEIIEELVNIAIGEGVLQSAFIDSFCEVKYRNLGDKTAWYSEGGLLTVSTFAGNHWDTNRQSLDLGEEFSLPKEWIFIHVFEDLERFLIGIAPLEKLLDKVYKSVNKYIQDRIYAQFSNVANAIPSDFVVSGNSEQAVGSLCDKVAAAGGYSEITIAGTRGALRKLAGIVPDKMFADSQKEAKASTGTIGSWEGNKLMVIPQTLQSGTFNLALSESQLFLIGGGVKPIKIDYYGDSRTKSDTSGQRNNDQTIDFQIQTLLGMGLVLPATTGLFTIT